MGAVFRGRHLRLNVEVAVKVMAPPGHLEAAQAASFVQRLMREAQTAANLVAYYKSLHTQGTR